MDTPDDPVDHLYRGRLDAFVADRNALAKRLKRPDLRALEKPTAPAWAVNQVFWHERAVFDALVVAAEAQRAAHRDALAGQPVDLRAAETTHRGALREALAAAQRALTSAGLAVSPATLDAVRRTLEAVPHPDARGRLVQPLLPAGLEALAGLTVSPSPARAAVAASPAVAPQVTSPTPSVPAPSGRGPATITPFPSRPDPASGRATARERETAAREAREREAKAREARQRAADEALRAAATDYERAQAAVAEAEAQLSEKRKARDTAAHAYERAKRAARELV